MVQIDASGKSSTINIAGIMPAPASVLFFFGSGYFGGSKYILLHDWEGNTVRGWQYWPDRREVSRELNISPYCPTQGSAVNMTLSCVSVAEEEKKREEKKSECFWSQTRPSRSRARCSNR